MTEATNSEALFFVIAAVILLIILVAAFSSFFQGFMSELRHLNTEIERTSGRERKYYVRKRRKLWLSLIPFVKK